MYGIIKQRNDIDCTVCCLGMALNTSYENILERIPNNSYYFRPDNEYGLSIVLTNKIAKSFGYRLVSIYPEVNPCDKTLIDKIGNIPALMTIQSINYRSYSRISTHMIYWDGQNVFDPSPKLQIPSIYAACPIYVQLFRSISEYDKWV